MFNTKKNKKKQNNKNNEEKEELNDNYIQKHIEEVYRLGDVLGTGNYSEVKSGTHKKTGVQYAIKCMSKEHLGDKGIEMVKNEVDILLECRIHPNIVKIHQVYETSTHYYLVMDLISGGELFDKIVQLKSYTEQDASLLIKQVISAVEFLHKHNIVHRDLKPENLLLANDTINSPILLADFGLSMRLAHGESLNVAVGTPGYVAPELVKCLDDENSSYGLQIDMWAVGVILYILLCGYPPFYADDDDEVFDQILEGDYDYPPAQWNNISPMAKDLIDHMLVLNPKKRYTAQQALDHPWLKDTHLPSVPLDSAVAEMKKFNARRKWKGAILATMAVARLESRVAILSLNSSSKEISITRRSPSTPSSSLSQTETFKKHEN